jgi:hypothetical protein
MRSGRDRDHGYKGVRKQMSTERTDRQGMGLSYEETSILRSEQGAYVDIKEKKSLIKLLVRLRPSGIVPVNRDLEIREH